MNERSNRISGQRRLTTKLRRARSSSTSPRNSPCDADATHSELPAPFKGIAMLFMFSASRAKEILASLWQDGYVRPAGKIRWQTAVEDGTVRFSHRFVLDGFTIEAVVRPTPTEELPMSIIGVGAFHTGVAEDHWFSPDENSDAHRALDLVRSHRKTWTCWRLTLSAMRGNVLIAKTVIDGLLGETHPEPDASFDAKVRANAPYLIEEAKRNLRRLVAGT